MEINLPILPLRDYQQRIWDKLIKDNIKRSFILMHRRAGKDVFCLQYLIQEAIDVPGNYWYILPQQNQVRRAIWEGITRDGVKYLSFIPEQVIEKISDMEMKVYLKNGSIISFIGGDRYDSLVGAGIRGAVISEYALQRPNLYDLAIEPMLRETKGWVLFNTTPRGNNHAKEMYEFLTKEMNEGRSAFTCKLTVDDTGGIVTAEDIEEERRRGKPEELIQQEYYCSFAGALQGAYYADMLNNCPLGDYPYDERYPVHTMWDLGVSDTMAIWFVQFCDGTIRVIDYYENHTYGLGHYANLVLDKKYRYAGHHLPHDGTHRQLTIDEKAQSIQNQLMRLGLENIDIIPRTTDVYADIQAVRGILPLCRFDNKTKLGYGCLRDYRREFDEKNRCFKETPLHDYTSHGCFSADTKILTTEGEKNIVDVRVGDYVITPMGKRRVLESGCTGIKKVIELDFGDRKIVCTPLHKFFTKKGLDYADDLGYNSDVFGIMKGERILWNTLSLFGLMEKNIGYREIITRATTGEVEQNFTERYGNTTLVKLYLMSITFIILMEIPLITIYQILYALVKKSIFRCTQKQASGVAVKQTKSNSKKHKSLLSCGTLVKRVINGTLNTVRSVGRKKNGLKQYVRFVAKNIQHPTQVVLNTVQVVASKNTTIIRKKERKIHIPVYNLTVEKDHCYYANGILVSNSDAFRILPYIYNKATKKVNYKARVAYGGGW